MKYIAAEVTGYALMTRDIEVEIDESKLEKALEEEMRHQSAEEWYGWGKPDDEMWIDIEVFADNFYVSENELAKQGDAIAEEWENMPDCAKVRDYNFNYDGDDAPHVKACIQWLQSKGWKYNADENVCYRKK